MTTSEEFAIDLASDTIRLYGVRYSLNMFRILAFCRPGSMFRVVEREGEILTLQSFDLPEPVDADP